jgi:hypothetical protein
VYLCRGLLLTICVGPRLLAATAPIAAPSLRQLSQKAGYIFAGTVTNVRKIQPTGPYNVATMQVTLRVDQAIRGVQPRQVITIREWIGLWSNGDRYREGERMLLFLYGKSKLGLTSPVSGAFGRFDIDQDGEIVLEAARVSGLAADPVLKVPLRGIPPWNSTTIRAQDFRRAVVRAMENER